MDTTELQDILAYLALKIRHASTTTITQSQLDQQVWRQYQLEEQILAAAESQQVCLTETTLQDAYLKMRDRYEEEADFIQALAEARLTPQGYRQALARDLRIEAVLEKIGHQAAAVTEQEIQTFYQQHPARFQQPERRRVRHLLLTVHNDQPGDSDTRVLQRITELHQQLLRQPQRFAELAARHSHCPTALEGGQLGLVSQGLLYAELDQILFQMQPGDISQPLRSPLGYHLLWLEEILPAQQATLEEARTRIHEYLTDWRKQAVQRRWIAQLNQTSGPKQSA